MSRDLQGEIRRALTDPAIQQAVPAATRLAAAHRRAAVADFRGYEQARERARAIKEAAIERLPELLAQLQEAVEAAGGTVHHAEDAQQAVAEARAVSVGELLLPRLGSHHPSGLIGSQDASREPSKRAGPQNRPHLAHFRAP